MGKKPTIEHVTASLKRWRSRLKRAMRMVEKLEKQQKRIESKPRVFAKVVDVTFVPDTTLVANLEKPGIVCVAPKGPPDDGIPAFLKREKPGTTVADQIKAEQAETKKKKARGRIEKMKAKKAGDLKKMPLSGKAALDHIRNG